MKNKESRRIVIIFFIISIYYLPYLLLDWIGVAGIKEGTAPIEYRILKLLLPTVFMVILNRKMKIKKSIINYISFLFVIVNILSNILHKSDGGSIEILIFFICFIFYPTLNFKYFKLKYLFSVFIFSLGSVLFEKYLLFKLLQVQPAFVMSWQERYLGNMGGPNILGSFINLIWLLLIFKFDDKNNKLKLLITLITFYIITLTDSDAAIIVFMLSLWYIILKKIKKLKIIYLLLSCWGAAMIIYLKIEGLINDGGNISRIKSVIYYLREIKLLNLEYIFNENTFFTILFSYGIIMAIMYILFWIELYLENVRSYKKIKKFYLMKQIIFGQVLLYSLVLPIKFSFPMNILYILSLKLDKKY